MSPTSSACWGCAHLGRGRDAESLSSICREGPTSLHHSSHLKSGVRKAKMGILARDAQKRRCENPEQRVIAKAPLSLHNPLRIAAPELG